WPATIRWQTSSHPAVMLAGTGVRLRRLTLTHPDAGALQTALSAVFSDDRVAVEAGPAGLHAVFATPHGDRTL
ncbi:MAG: VOC family protein, partial [Pseudomonadota bacterium]